MMMAGSRLHEVNLRYFNYVYKLYAAYILIWPTDWRLA